MTEKKIVPKTLLNVLDNPIMKKILNRESDLTDEIKKVQSWWAMDLYSRKPGPAFRDGVFKGTDLDLACFLYTLAQRKANINIPFYKSMRPKSLTEGQMVTSKENRHGKIVSLTSNKDVFSFSIKIFDENVLNADGTKGDFRNFTITDPDGNMYDGWTTIQWKPTNDEDKFLMENLLMTENKVIFKNFVHPNRWTSFYGQYYFITKALIDRLKDQCKDCFAQMKRMQANGIKYPETGEGAKTEWPSSLKAKGKKVEFDALEVEVDVPEYENDYPYFDDSQANLIYLTDLRKFWTYTIIPTLQFATRCTELAFFKHDKGKLPFWFGGAIEWERDFKFPKKRIKWDRLKLFQPGVGEYSVSIRKRVKQKTEIMDKSYNKK